MLPRWLQSGRSSPPLAACLLACALALPATGCGEEETAPSATPASDALPAMGFQVDTSLLAEPRQFAGFDIELRPPLDWVPLPDDQLAAVAQAVAPTPTTPTTAPTPATRPADAGQQVDAEPLAAFLGPAEGSGAPPVLIVSSVDAASAERTEVLLRESFEEVRSGDFRVGTVPVRMFNIAPPELVGYKVLVRPESPVEGRVLQLDYVVGRAGFADAGPRIESSIGSLRPAPQTQGAAGE